MRNPFTRPSSIHAIDDDTSGSIADDGAESRAFEVAISRSGRVRRVAMDAAGESVLDAAVGYRLTSLGLTRQAAATCLVKARRVFRTGNADAFDLVGGLDIARACAVELTPSFDAEPLVSMVRMRMRAVVRSGRRRRDPVEQRRVAHADLVATVLRALRSSMNGIQLWSHVLEQHMADAAENATTRRACDGIRSGIRQQVVLIDRLHDAASAVVGDRPTRASEVTQADDKSVRPVSRTPPSTEIEPSPECAHDVRNTPRGCRHPHAGSAVNRRPRRWMRRAPTR